MPIRLDDIEKYGAPIAFLAPGEIQVRTGPCSATFWRGESIPLDGRHYVCAGTVHLKTGKSLRANFEINTHTFDFLDRETVKVYLNRAWYSIDEDELFSMIGLTKEESLPYTWTPDRPLDYHEQAPYPMTWPAD